MSNFEKLFEPIKIGPMEVKNRFVMAPMVTNYCESDGTVTERLKAYHKARAKGGIGLIIVEATYVHPCGKGFSNELGIYKDELIDGLKGLVDEVHQYGTKIAVQLYLSGRQSYTAVTGAPLIAPSPIPCPVCQEMPREMTREDINNMIEAYGEGARRAKAAGFDAVEIHGAHGYLINQFLSAYSNKRTDEYGGSLETRARFPLEVLKKVREVVGDNFPILYRMSSVEHVPEGLTIEDTTEFSKMLVENGVDAIHVSGGVYQSAAMIIQPAAIPQGVYVENATAIKEAIGGKVPVIVVGRIKDPAMAEEIIESGKADMIAMGRAFLADEELPSKLKGGKLKEIRKCIACNQGCIDRLFADQDIACLGNALVGREWQYDMDQKASEKKRVLVIGGGPGGLESARVAALRGHEVFLYEKNQELGGQMNVASIPPYKEEFNELAGYLISQVENLGVNITTGKEANENVIDSIKPDAIIMATGSKPDIPDIPGIENENVVTAEDVLTGAAFGHNVVVVGGGLVGCETAEFLADKGAKVTVVEMLEDVAMDMGLLDKALLMERMNQKGIKIITGGTVKEVKKDGLVMEKGGKDETLSGIDKIVLAVGYKSDVSMQKLLEDKKIPFYKIGDCAEPRKITEAIQEGFLRAYEL